MNCLLKNIPSENLLTPYDGNRGIGFPLQSVCEVLPQPVPPLPPYCPGNELLNSQFEDSVVQNVGGSATNWILNNVDVHDISIYGFNDQPRNPFLDLVSVGFGPGVATQVVSSLNINDTYNMYFYVGADKQSASSTTNSRTVRVGVWNGSTIVQTSAYQLTAQNVATAYESFGWQLYSFQFLAPNSTLTISFSGFTTQFAYGPVLDDICLLNANLPPPEPPIVVPVIEGCYLALEFGTDPQLSPITLVGYPDLSSTSAWNTLGENSLSANSSWINAPCVSEIEFCYLVKEEDGFTNLEREENEEYFEVECP